jgi:hypothetical protein
MSFRGGSRGILFLQLQGNTRFLPSVEMTDKAKTMIATQSLMGEGLGEGGKTSAEANS